MAILQVISYDSYPYNDNKNFINHPQNGLERHISGLHNMYGEYNYYLAINNYDQSFTLSSYSSLGEVIEYYKLNIKMTNNFICQDKQALNEIVNVIISECNIEIVHFHFQQPIILDMINIISENKKLQLIHTLHDLSYACGNYSCDFDYEVSAEVIEALNKIDLLIFPTKIAEEIYKEKCNLNVKTAIIPHGTDIQKINNNNISDNKFSVLFLGAINVIKGGEIIAEIIECRLDGIQWNILGRIEVENLQNNINYKYHGTYTSFDLQKKFTDIQPNLVVLPSQVFETFSYNLEDCLAAGIPVVVPYLGAMKRIEDKGIGWFVEEQTVDAYVKCVQDIVANKDMYQSVKEQVMKYKVQTVEKMNQQYEIYYQKSTKKQINYKEKITNKTIKYQKTMARELMEKHRDFLQEQKNSQQHLDAYGELANEHNKLAVEYHELNTRIGKLLSIRIIGKINRYVWKRDNVSKKTDI